MRSMPTVAPVPGLAADGAMRSAQYRALTSRYDVRVADVHFKGDTLAAMAAALLEADPGAAHAGEDFIAARLTLQPRTALGVTASRACCETTSRRARPDASG